MTKTKTRIRTSGGARGTHSAPHSRSKGRPRPVSASGAATGNVAESQSRADRSSEPDAAARSLSIEVAAARLFAAFMGHHDTDDDFADPLVLAMHEHTVGLRDLVTHDERDTMDLYLTMIEGATPRFGVGGGGKRREPV